MSCKVQTWARSPWDNMSSGLLWNFFQLLHSHPAQPHHQGLEQAFTEETNPRHGRPSCHASKRWKNMWICNCREKKSGYIKNCIVQLNWTLAVSLIVSRAWTHSGDGWHASRTRNCLTWRRPRPLSSAHLDNATSAKRERVAQLRLPWPANLLPRHEENFKDG